MFICCRWLAHTYIRRVFSVLFLLWLYSIYFNLLQSTVNDNYKSDHSVSPPAAAAPQTTTTTTTTTTTVSDLESGRQAEVAKYVSQCFLRHYGNPRTGNHLFALAAMLYVAELTGRQVLVKTTRWCLDDIFQLDWIQRYNGSQTITVGERNALLCPCRVLFTDYKYNGEELHFAAGNSYKHQSAHQLDQSDRTTSDRQRPLDRVLRVPVALHFTATDLSRQLRTSPEKTLLLCGGHQTHFYADQLGQSLRSRLRFRPEIQRTARLFLDSTRPAGWFPGSYTRVGVHTRRGDFLRPWFRRFGVTVVDSRYVQNAVSYFTARHDRLQLLVATDDLSWCMHTVDELFATPTSFWYNSSRSAVSLHVNNSLVVTFSVANSAGVDLALLASADALIISTGSYGWWAAWLANKTTLYYSNYPRPKSLFDTGFSRSSYFPTRWIPMT